MVSELGRRRFLQTVAAGAVSTALSSPVTVRCAESKPVRRKAQIAITLDLEMSAQYPRSGMTEWNFQKGNLDEPTKQYSVDAARLVKQFDGRLHFFCVGRVLEQPDVEWLQGIAAAGHPIGNHTYDHVYVLARKPEETQFRFRRAPWLVKDMSAAEIISTNIRLTTAALKERAGIEVNGFRTPGGFYSALDGREDVQTMLQDAGFTWTSSKYPQHLSGEIGKPPSEEVYESIVDAQVAAQPYRYPTGLIEIPMSPISDVTAFRSKKWNLEWFLEATRRNVNWAIENGGVFDFIAHPSCLVVEDPKLETIRLMCEMVKAAGDRAEIVTLDRIAANMGDAK
jgi:peptidoglycan/xylan/chitin deacetylase (PgdA/CDA1 family)